MTRVAIGFGSNLGNRKAHLINGLKALTRFAHLEAVSSLYESAPIGPVEQGPFLNAVAVFETSARPRSLLVELLAVEAREGRTRRVRWGPRTLDLDLLLFGEERVEFDDLCVPHPELPTRRFVLDPLLEAWPDATLPDGSPLRWFRADVEDQPVARVGTWVSWWRLLWWRVTGSGRRRNLTP